MRVAAKCYDNLVQDALKVSMMHSEDEVLTAGRAIQKERFMPQLDPRRVAFSLEEQMWLKLTDKDDVPIGLVGVVHERLGHVQSLEDYWKTVFDHSFGVDGKPALKKINMPYDLSIQGNLAYIGELYINKENRGKRKILKNLLTVTHALAFARWQADWHYAFVKDRHVSIGQALVYGFSRHSPEIFDWGTPPSGARNDDWLVCSSRKDILRYLGSQSD